MSIIAILSPRLYFSYNQFMVYDSTVSTPGCAWTEEHSAQGFARRDSSVCFNSILECGSAVVTAIIGSYQPDEEYERVIAVPFVVESSKVLIEGPEEFDSGRVIALEPGNYRLVVAQCVIDDDCERIDLFFERSEEPLQRSIIILADEMLNPPNSLLETADIAG